MTQYRLLSLALILFLVLLVGCQSDGNKDRDRDKGGIARIDGVPLMTSNAQGNMTVVNTADEALIVSTSPTFETGSGSIWRLTATSATVDLHHLGGTTDVVRLHVLRARDLQRARGGTPLAELEVITSPAFTTREGGTWNPFGSLRGSDHTLTGTLLVCNYTEEIIGITVGHPMNALEGIVNRGACNVPLRLPADGLTTVYAVEVPYLSVVREAEVAIFDGQRSELVVGEREQPPSTATLRLTSSTQWHANVRDAMTGQPLYSSACNNCSTVMAGGSGDFTIAANREVRIELSTTDGMHTVLSPVVAVATGDRVDMVLQRNEAGEPEITIAPPVYDPYEDYCLAEDNQWLNLYYCQ